MTSEGCNILQVVKVNVKFVHDRHFPGFEAATEAEISRDSNITLKDQVNVKSSLIFIYNISVICTKIPKSGNKKYINIVISIDRLVYS